MHVMCLCVPMPNFVYLYGETLDSLLNYNVGQNEFQKRAPPRCNEFVGVCQHPCFTELPEAAVTLVVSG